MQEYEDRVYDVPVNVTIAAGAVLADQAQEIKNADAEWYFTGVTSLQTAGGGYVAVRFKDYTGRALATNPALLESIASAEQQAPAGSVNYLRWPKNGAIRFDVQELSGADSATVQMLLRGFKRYRKGEAPCL